MKSIATLKTLVLFSLLFSMGAFAQNPSKTLPADLELESNMRNLDKRNGK